MILKKNKFLFFLFVLFPIALILNIYCSIPSKIVLSENAPYSLKISSVCGIDGKNTLKSVSANNKSFVVNNDNVLDIDTSQCGNYDFSVNLFGKIPLKTVSVSVLPQKYVVPSGDTIGIKIYTDGLLVVSVSDFCDDKGNMVAPAKSAGIKEGDRIVSINGEEIKTIEAFAEILNNTDTAELTIIRKDEKINTKITPKKSADDNKIRIGAWVRDSTAGIGTLTFYNPKDSRFGALGHAICDTDTGEIMKVRQGNILTCDIMSITKGEVGTPGEIVGSFSQKSLGSIKENTQLGIFGELKNFSDVSFADAVEVATRYQIKEGEASILSNVDGEGVREYSAEILKISKSNRVDNKGMVIKITDQELLAKTGGIVQGMSGAPILQGGKLVGAVTHVFVNDPTRGYGIFIENMLDEANKIK